MTSFPAPWLLRDYVLPRLRPATCMSAAPGRRSSTGCTPAGLAACSCCASRIPTSSARPPTWSPASWKASAGSAWTGMKAPRWAARTARISSRSASTATARWGSASCAKGTATTATATPRRRPKPATATRRKATRRAAKPGPTIAGACGSRPRRSPPGRRPATPRAIRFKVPAGSTSFHDLVHGDIAFDNTNIEDFVALRSDGYPTYHLSVVVDDLDMAITHVVRGDDHISNTPKQVLLYRAFGAEVPSFAHVPLILGPDKRRLSKRHGATSVMEYARQGYVPEAMVNFLALLGWSPGRDQGAVRARRSDRRLLARGHQQQQRGVQPGEARLVQRAAHPGDAG